MNNLPDFYSVRDINQIDYAFENMNNKKCLLFLQNGFASSLVETNKRDIRFIWDGFLLFVDKNITINDLKNNTNLYNQRLVAFQRTSFSQKTNNPDTIEYIIKKLKTDSIPYEIMPDIKEVNGYPSKADMWSTRDESILEDAIDTIKEGQFSFYELPTFNFTISFNKTNIPDINYNHKSALVLKNNEQEIVIRILNNQNTIANQVKTKVGDNTIIRNDTQRAVPGGEISSLRKK